MFRTAVPCIPSARTRPGGTYAAAAARAVAAAACVRAAGLADATPAWASNAPPVIRTPRPNSHRRTARPLPAPLACPPTPRLGYLAPLVPVKNDVAL